MLNLTAIRFPPILFPNFRHSLQPGITDTG